MHTFTYPRPHFHGLFSNVSGGTRRLAGWVKDWVMFRLIGWFATIGLVGVLIWCTAADVSFTSKIVAGAALAMIGLVCGLRLSSSSNASYIEDIQRLNKVLADQNDELEKANSMLLKELSAGFNPPVRSQSA